MNLRSTAAAAVSGLIGSGPVAGVAERVTAGRLRTIAYHGVPDGDALAAQLRLIRRHYQPVTEAMVAEAMGGGEPLPPRAVWITFDDGDPTVVENGLPVLAAAGMSATLYICPGLIEAVAPPWWRIVALAGERGLGAPVDGVHRQGHALVVALKRVPDRERRAVVEDLRVALGASLPTDEALTDAQMQRWVDAGFSLGNHTWDHPCLDRCDPAEQAEQLERAHRWIVDRLGVQDPSFAYPNGDHTEHAESVLAGLGYRRALLFDHRLTRVPGPSLRMSRVRLDASAPPNRARSVLSGAHTGLFGLSRKAAGRA